MVGSKYQYDPEFPSKDHDKQQSATTPVWKLLQQYQQLGGPGGLNGAFESLDAQRASSVSKFLYLMIIHKLPSYLNRYLNWAPKKIEINKYFQYKNDFLTLRAYELVPAWKKLGTYLLNNWVGNLLHTYVGRYVLLGLQVKNPIFTTSFLMKYIYYNFVLSA